MRNFKWEGTFLSVLWIAVLALVVAVASSAFVVGCGESGVDVSGGEWGHERQYYNGGGGVSYTRNDSSFWYSDSDLVWIIGKYDELRAYRDSVEAERALWSKADAAVRAIGYEKLSASGALSCVVELAQGGFFSHLISAGSIGCDGDTIPGMSYRWQVEFTQAAPADIHLFIPTGATDRRIRLHPIDSEGRTGCAPGDTAWSEWGEW